jgi:3'-phosphoadenosine 5'-phosphosulfate sulfotransferase (PAPS reductase)/FAD synthetase
VSINKETRKKRLENKKNSFAINPEQMEFERRKVLEQMSTKIDRKKLNNMAAVAATKEPEYFDEEGNKREPTMRILSLGAGVQSSCLALMAQEGLTKHKPDYMIFADTGWEPKFVYEHVEYLKKAITICPLITVERGNIREDLMRKNRLLDVYQTHRCLLLVLVEE